MTTGDTTILSVVLARTLHRHRHVVTALLAAPRDRQCRETLRYYREEVEALETVVTTLSAAGQ